MKTVTAKEAQRQIQNLNPQEKARIDAFLKYNRFDLAAKALGCDPDTVSTTWKRYSHLLRAVIAGIDALKADDFSPF